MIKTNELSCNMEITGIELENPYRYRAYFIGTQAMYNNENESYITVESGNVSYIKPIYDDNGDIVSYAIKFDSGECVEVIANVSGLIVHYN